MSFIAICVLIQNAKDNHVVRGLNKFLEVSTKAYCENKYVLRTIENGGWATFQGLDFKANYRLGARLLVTYLTSLNFKISDVVATLLPYCQ
ncbi:hypothetical protein [Mesonia sp. HuA40]|uniref:hypothetical protein n=1 Tax=Mesonia sp. HuA40 TaxID=2602761 RepID=UPI0011CB0301|nr:hypothetical protein [Mesonia sp. HuA40]TXK73616.1 hypothetical protein FT993_04705 [Mesonia sp. HuA40]